MPTVKAKQDIMTLSNAALSNQAEQGPFMSGLETGDPIICRTVVAHDYQGELKGFCKWEFDLRFL